MNGLNSSRTPAVIAVVLAVIGVTLAWRSFATRNDIPGHVGESLNESPPVYQPTRLNEPDPPFTANVHREVLPAFDLSSAELPIELQLPAQTGTEPFRIEGELRHDDPDFTGGVVSVAILAQHPADPEAWIMGWGKSERSVLEDGRHVFRLSSPAPGGPGTFKVEIQVVYKRLDIEDFDSLPRSEHLAIVPVAEGMVEFRE